VSDEFDTEPIPGLPGMLPPGETILWQGQPRWRGLARHCFEVRWLSVYFGVFIAARGALALRDGLGVSAALTMTGVLTLLALACLGLLSLLAWLNARATIYTITSRRVVMRFGVALPMSVNLPFKRLEKAELALRPDGEGDIALQVGGPGRLAYLHLWPHARPWRFSRAEPMLRAVPDAKRVSELLAEAVRAWAAAEAPSMTVASGDSRPPEQPRLAEA
jgi:hypothetical protein